MSAIFINIKLSTNVLRKMSNVFSKPEFIDGLMVVSTNTETLDASNVKEFKEELLNILHLHIDKDLVLNLSNIKFIDSSGLGTLISVLRVMTVRRRELYLSNLTAPVKALFELMRMHKVFELVHDVKEISTRRPQVNP